MAPAPLPPLSDRRRPGLRLSQLGVSVDALRTLPHESASRPKTTNMRRPIDLLPVMPVRRRAPTPADADDDGTGDIARCFAPAPQPTPQPAMLMAMPCLRVRHLPLSVAFYTRVLRFRRRASSVARLAPCRA
ncbi:hypothetical protein MCAP1_000411 [Malassezia caprae]|uniref:Uncharacterized protein n=1 Tax=Malassezia caprae TaxID=1381934 RepID=A0AAF0E440_9BASI|nr:hypothetical protein MCAP1_000411 [Malassezia caprae]